jgi:hypothetical protein
LIAISDDLVAVHEDRDALAPRDRVRNNVSETNSRPMISAMARSS